MTKKAGDFGRRGPLGSGKKKKVGSSKSSPSGGRLNQDRKNAKRAFSKKGLVVKEVDITP